MRAYVLYFQDKLAATKENASNGWAIFRGLVSAAELANNFLQLRQNPDHNMYGYESDEYSDEY